MDRVLHIEGKQFQYIARISHGKDSLKMLDVIVSRGLPLDRVTTTDIWATDTIRGEHPKMVAFKEQADEFIWRKYHIEVEHLCAMRDGEKLTYEKLFYHVPKRKPKNAGKCKWEQGTILGFPTLFGPWCQSYLKRDVKDRANDKRVSIHKPWFRPDSIMGFPVSFTNKGTWCQKLKTRFLERPDAGKGMNIVEYLGIAADEPKRFGQLSERKRAPLVEFGIEEELCGLYCKYNGILSPSYETSCRDGCWMCHNQGVNQLRQLRKNYPNLWALLLRWDADSPVSFKPDGRTVHDYDWRFQLEDEGCLLPDDKTFRWKLLDSDMVNTRIF